MEMNAKLVLAIMAMCFFAGLTDFGRDVSAYSLVAFLTVVIFFIAVIIHSSRHMDGS